LRIDARDLPARGVAAFSIAPSEDRAGTRAAIALQPDAASCTACMIEVLDPSNRRYRYPFTTCAACGPRYSVAEALPFDRARTTLRDFPPCADCAAEYADPSSRRFHAQTLTCAACGPRLSLRDPSGELLSEGDEALLGAAEALARGACVAAKGTGGYHLLVDASSESAVARLRERKRRPHKPLAVMVASLDEARALAEIDEDEARLLLSSAAPIVLLRDRRKLAPGVAPGVGRLGLMLASTPLHHLLLAALGRPLVATSGNRSDEPLCTEPEEARRRLGGIADRFLDHDRRIARPIDDPVLHLVAGRPQLLRRGRGYVPAHLPLSVPSSRPRLALGAHLKSALALALETRLHLGEHLGTLDGRLAREHFVRQTAALPALFGVRGPGLVCDAHPDYFSTAFAERADPSVLRVQHHHAHALAALVDAGLDPPALAAVWDGGGDGTDGTIWGGELLGIDADHGITRLACLRPFPLPGGELAVREPRRAALGLMYALRGSSLWIDPPAELQAQFTHEEWTILRELLARGINAPMCSSVGRLFDAAAALCGLRGTTTFEGQAAMELEALAATAPQEAPYPVRLDDGEARTHFWIDWAPLVEELLRDGLSGVSIARRAARFHRGLAQALVQVTTPFRARSVLLSGGVFQNRVLTEEAIRMLRAAGREPIWHQHVPPGDGGIAVGQALAAAIADRRAEREDLACA
jgi:hydrogenase maturation protein HypF